MSPDKIATISQTTFSNVFPGTKMYEFPLSRGLAPNQRQAVIRTNADPLHVYIYTYIYICIWVPGGDELTLEYCEGGSD